MNRNIEKKLVVTLSLRGLNFIIRQKSHKDTRAQKIGHKFLCQFK